MPERGRYMISIAAELAGLHPQTLRMYEARGLVRPARTPGGTRLYSETDVERLRLIQRLTTELGLNLAGVEHVLRLEDELRPPAHPDGAARARAARRDRVDAQAVPARGRAVPPAATAGHEELGDMDFEKLTIKSGEAVAGAQELARRAGNPELTPDHLTIALLDQELPRTLVERAGASAGTLRAEAEARIDQQPSVSAVGRSRRLGGVPSGPRTVLSRKRRRSATSSSRSSTSCSRSSSSRATRCSPRSRRCAAASASRRRTRRAPTRRSRSTAAT